MVIVPLLAGAGVGLGVVVALAGLRGGPRLPARPRAVFRADRVLLDLGTGVAATVATFALTRWLVAALLAGVGAVVVRRQVAQQQRRTGTVERTEAVAAWAEMLRDTLAGAAGIEQAIASTAAVAPDAVREPVRRLAAGLERGRLAPALRAFADELADPAADLVVTALLLATERRARELGPMLGAVATSARREAELLLHVEASRSRTRTAARVVTATTLGFAGVLVVFNRPFLRPYDDAVGQAWLLVVGMVFALAFWQLQRLARIETPTRVFAGRAAPRSA